MADAREVKNTASGTNPKTAAPAAPGKTAPGNPEAEVKATSPASETREIREANAAPVQPGPQPEPLLDERDNLRAGPEANPDNKAFPDPESGAHPAPLEKTKKERKLQAHEVDPYRDPHAAMQEDQQWIINRRQAEMTTSDTPAGDSSPAPEAVDSANWVDRPARAHTLAEPDDYGTADSVGQRLRRAQESARLEERPANRGIHSDKLPGAYSVEEELRLQWPGISLGDDAAPEETSPDKE